MPQQKKTSKTAKNLTTSVLIVGGGPAGLTLACLLGSQGIQTICLDREDPVEQLKEKFDGRTTALSSASMRVLKAAGVWPLLEKDAEPILDIRVADGASPLFLHFASEETADGPFGWIVDNKILRQALFGRLEKLKSVTHLTSCLAQDFSDTGNAAITVRTADGYTIRASLLIGADGRSSAVRNWRKIKMRSFDYGQTAIVCCAEHELDHENAAVEHFCPAGPFAVLPMRRGKGGVYRSSVVWCEAPANAKKILALDAHKFDQKLAQKFGDHLGSVRHAGARMGYPLKLMMATSYVAKRTALIGEAAHAIHPVAGQGLNLSMRDIAVLAELIENYAGLGLDIGSVSLLKAYQALRHMDNLMMAVVTDGLVRLFSNDRRILRFLRDSGLGIVQRLPPLKRFFSRQAMGLMGKTPKIVKKGVLSINR